MNRIAVTGAFGFLGWHLSCRLAAVRGQEPIRLGRAEFADPGLLADRLSTVDTVIHVAGINRADANDAVEQGNVELAETLAAALGERPVHVVYANSIQMDGDSSYGRGKRLAGEVLAKLPGTMTDVILPNLFGEHGKPAYNSFVATFCHEVANGRQPTITVNRTVPLLHAQRAAELLIAAAERKEDCVVRPQGDLRQVSDVLALINAFHNSYAELGEIPDLSTNFSRDLFNTYRSYLFPQAYPIYPEMHVDERGVLVETARSHGGTGQSFASTTVPGAVRGDHFHLHKFERFMVVRGEAEIAVRRLYDKAVVRILVSGEEPGFVDMPTMWTHNIRNVGDQDLITVFWSDQLLNRREPDQYPLAVEERP